MTAVAGRTRGADKRTMEIGAEKLPRLLQVLLGLALGAVAVAWALTGLAYVLALGLAVSWHAGPSWLTAYLLAQLACAALGAPLMVRVALHLQRPHDHVALAHGTARRLAVAFTLASAMSAAAALASAL